MATMDVGALKALDKHFASGLAARDERVLCEIDKKLAPFVRSLLERNKGPRLTAEDIDDVMQRSLLDLWNNFRAEKNVGVIWFFVKIAKNRMLDQMRKNTRLRSRSKQHLAGAAEDDVSTAQDGQWVLISRETQAQDNEILRIIDEMLSDLTQRQQKAFSSRFFGVERNWAKKLEHETGIDAKKWRKYSDSAKKKIEKKLEARGVKFSGEGDQDEVA